MSKFQPDGDTFDFNVPSLADPGVEVWYNVTMKVSNLYAYFGAGSGADTPACFSNGWNNAGQAGSSCSELLLSSTGVKFHWYVWYTPNVPSTFTASVCLLQRQPTAMPIVVPATPATGN
jgi:hypothetical protein